MKRLTKWPTFTEWFFGVVIVMTLDLLIGLVFILPLYLLERNDSNWQATVGLVSLLIGAAIMPVIAFRWTRFFVRVASRKLFRQNHQSR